MGSTALVATSWLARFGFRFPGLGFCRWSGRPCACCPCALRAVRDCLPIGCSLSACFCLALQVYSPSFPSLRARSLSLSLGSSCSSLSLLGLFLVGSGVCLCCHCSSCCPSPSFLWHTCWYPSVHLRLSSGSLFSPFLVGSSSSTFPWRPSSPFFWFCLGRWLVFLTFSSACRLVMDHRLLSSLWFGSCFIYHPCSPTPGISLASWLLHRFFPWGLVEVCFP